MNDKERREWVMNDENLYMWWRVNFQHSKMSLYRFVKENRETLTNYINRQLKKHKEGRSQYDS